MDAGWWVVLALASVVGALAAWIQYPTRVAEGTAVVRSNRRRAAVFFAGLAAAAIPTLFTVFPHLTETASYRLYIVGGVWLFAAFVIVIGSLIQEEHVREIHETVVPAPPVLEISRGLAEERREERREAVIPYLMQAVLSNPPGVPAGHEFRVYTFDEDASVLVPTFSSESSLGAQVWEPGRGATGTAWETGQRVLAIGEEVHDETFKLTTAEQARYQDLQAVASLPVTTADGRPLGVLTASSTSDPKFLASADGAEAQFVLAAAVASLLQGVGDERP